METRAFFVVLIVVLFWLAPSPKSSEARDSKPIGVAVRTTASAASATTAAREVITSDISIKPYRRPDRMADHRE